MELEFVVGPDAQARLAQYLDRIGDLLGNKKRRASFAIYTMGLLGEGERKSVEPIAARACGDPTATDPLHQRLLHFLVDSAWSDAAVRGEAARHVVAALTARAKIDAWIVDDTGFLKQGKHSVGVQRQYTGSAGKVTNCQIGVSLALSTPTEHVPVDFELYMPKDWVNDPVRRREARVPDSLTFKTKPEIALALIDQAIANGVPRGVVLADTAYGNSSGFRKGLRERELDYGVAVDSTTKVWSVDAQGARQGEALTIRELALRICYQRRGYRRVTWRDGTKKKLSARFAFRRVVPFHDDGHDPATDRERVWLVCEWPDDEVQPTKFYFATLPKTWSKKRLIRLIKERWRTERAYEDLKGELGLDHYEGRRFPGWHHHISTVLACYAFLVAERVRRFPPSPRRAEAYDAHALAA